MSVRANILGSSVPTRKGPIKEWEWRAGLYLLGASSFIEYSLIGRIFFPELILVALAPYMLIWRARILFRPVPATFLFLLVLWLGSQMLTDTIRDTAFEDWTRGWAKITFTIFNFVAIWTLCYAEPLRLLYLLVGLATGSAFVQLLNLDPSDWTSAWKFAIGPLLVIVCCTAYPMLPSSERVKSDLAAAALGILGMISLILMDSRSLALFTFMTAAITATNGRRAHRRNLKITASSIGVPLLLLIIVAGASLLLYEHAANSGWLGKQAQYRYEVQSKSDLGLIIGGRSEILISSEAIADSPIIGHGSWAKSAYYREEYAALQRRLGIVYSEEDRLEGDLIPTHSFLMGSWVEAGVGGAFVWIFCIILVGQAIVVVITGRLLYTSAIFFLLTRFCWDILFSPFGADRRIIVPALIALAMMVVMGRWPTQGKIYVKQ